MNTSTMAQARSVSRPGLREVDVVMADSERARPEKIPSPPDIFDEPWWVSVRATRGTGRRASRMLLDQPDHRAPVARRRRLAQCPLQPGVRRSGRRADPAADAQHVGVVAAQQLQDRKST